MRPIVSIDIGQVGNKNDSGTICIVHICVFNFTLVVCAVRLSSILFFSFSSLSCSIFYSYTHFRNKK